MRRAKKASTGKLNLERYLVCFPTPKQSRKHEEYNVRTTETAIRTTMAINIPGLIAVIAFYIAILVIGIVYGRKTGKSKSNEAVLLADRSLGGFVSVFTITATMVGGGYLNGSAESASRDGVLYAQAPVGYCAGLLISALLYAPKMRGEGYITMFDPLQMKYGKHIGALLIIPQIFGDLFWSAAVLAALGATISIILDINATLAIVISSAVAIFYTFMGGLYSVAYTDVIQLLFIAVGLIVAFPFSLTHPAVDLERVADNWLGDIPQKTIASYVDVFLLCICGGIPWQAFYQRILACRTVRVAQISTSIASVFALLMAIPAVVMGIAGSAADWNATNYDGPIPLPDDMASFMLPLALNYLSPLPIAILGIGAISAAVMSSADSCILSTSSILTKNVYQDIIRPKASETELVWVLRISILVVGTLGTLIAIFADTIYGLFILCSDLMYVVLFPQLTITLWMPQSNSYGSLTGFVVSFGLRLLSGEPVLGLAPVIRYYGYDAAMDTQLFPFRTFIMLIGAVCIVTVSLLTNFVFSSGIIPERYDYLKCLRQRTISMRTDTIVRQPQEIEAFGATSTMKCSQNGASANNQLE
ncbi:high-affinity choline transporter 1-like [Elysia marginata]|uniref:High-affinity choline transporter 1-like n=1 Tax=Elysia marginata TaxID=1093978 RepID=A0AAV4IJN3_9GAST|nr:high-affinity choline transporter 1-like [Elysia marginata]